MSLRKAAEMALEALEMFCEHGAILRPLETKKALRQALAQPQQESIKEPFNSKTGVKEAFILDRGCWERGCMAYDTRDCDEGVTVYVDAVNMSQERVDETAKREHEPIGYINGVHGGYMVFTPINPSAVYLNGTALFLAPPKSEWVGLTDEEILDIADSFGSFQYGDAQGHKRLDFAKSIEAKLKEKNT